MRLDQIFPGDTGDQCELYMRAEPAPDNRDGQSVAPVTDRSRQAQHTGIRNREGGIDSRRTQAYRSGRDFE